MPPVQPTCTAVHVDAFRPFSVHICKCPRKLWECVCVLCMFVRKIDARLPIEQTILQDEFAFQFIVDAIREWSRKLGMNSQLMCEYIYM